MLQIREQEILSRLVDMYERRVYSNSDFKQAVLLRIREREFPEYFNDPKGYFDAIKSLVAKNKVIIRYERYSIDFNRIDLNIENIDKIYNALGKKNVNEIISDFEEEFFSYKNNETIKKIQDDYLLRRKEKRSIKRFLHESFLDVIKAIYHMELNEEEIYERNFSIIVFNDSKRFETLKPRIITYYDNDESVFEKYLIIKKPSYLHLKGSGIVTLNKGRVDLSMLNITLGIPIEFDTTISFDEIERVIVVENEAIFHSFDNENALIMHIDDSSNANKVFILKMLKEVTSEIYYYSDINYEGFKRLSFLRRAVGKEIKPYNMNITTLRTNHLYQKQITNSSYIDNLKSLLENSNLEDLNEVIQYMIERKVILEQESIN